MWQIKHTVHKRTQTHASGRITNKKNIVDEKKVSLMKSCFVDNGNDNDDDVAIATLIILIYFERETARYLFAAVCC